MFFHYFISENTPLEKGVALQLYLNLLYPMKLLAKLVETGPVNVVLEKNMKM